MGGGLISETLITHKALIIRECCSLSLSLSACSDEVSVSKSTASKLYRDEVGEGVGKISLRSGRLVGV